MRIRYGMVGGGEGAFIGAVHRMAARLDDRYELVAGALCSDPERARASAGDLGIAPDRAYPDFGTMAAGINVMVAGHISVKKKAMACVAEFGRTTIPTTGRSTIHIGFASEVVSTSR